MENEYETAEHILKTVRDELSRIISSDGEDITYFNHGILDSLIVGLINAKTYMAMAETKHKKTDMKRIKK